MPVPGKRRPGAGTRRRAATATPLTAASGKRSSRRNVKNASLPDRCTTNSRPSTSIARLMSELDRRDRRELLDPEWAELPAVAGLAEAAERCGRVERTAVDTDLTGAESAGNAQRPVTVGRPNGTREPVRRAVGNADRGLVTPIVRNDSE